MYKSDSEVIRHRKKKPSSTSKSSSKSDHRHSYNECLVEYKHGHLSLGKECGICKRLIVTKFIVTEGNRLLRSEEVRLKYPNLPIRKG